MKYKRLLIITLSIALLFGGMYTFDYFRAKSFELIVEEINPEKPVADVRNQVTVKIKLTRKGQPVQGHTLFALPLNGGTMKGNRAVTDENGIAVFTYIPYTATTLQPARDVRVAVIDESNSIFIEVNAEMEFVIELQPKPKVSTEN